MKACKCNETLGNTGVAGCKTVAKVTKGLILVPTYDSTGAKNFLDLTTPLTQSVLDGLVNQADPTKRWYPIQDLENVTSTRAESVFETAPSGKKAFIKQGVRSLSMEVWNEGSAFKEQLDKVRCKGASVFLIDSDGSIRGIGADNNKLYPILIDKDSWNVNLIEATDSTISKVQITFDFDNNEDDAALRMVTAESITADLLGAKGLLDVVFVTIPTAGTVNDISFGLKLKQTFGNYGVDVPVKGLTIANFSVLNTTNSTLITLLSVTENLGNYVLTFVTPQVTGEYATVTVTKNGFDFTDVNTNTIVLN